MMNTFVAFFVFVLIATAALGQLPEAAAATSRDEEEHLVFAQVVG
jgi:hypothetical protein